MVRNMYILITLSILLIPLVGHYACPGNNANVKETFTHQDRFAILYEL